MDRYTTNIAGAQGGFIDNFIRPAFEVLQQILPETSKNIMQMEENKRQWKALEDDYDPANKYTQKEIEEDKVVEEDEEDSFYSQDEGESEGDSEEEEEDGYSEKRQLYKDESEDETNRKKYGVVTPVKEERTSSF
mmetsp:Transcript_20863/g.23197  ORF Transcript_20863/g.23197 Transcript_20863/m.23197 type:complete len:135 (+) Transcript_20863:1794-2198(+)